MKNSIIKTLLVIAVLYFQSCNDNDVKCPEESINKFRVNFNRVTDKTSNRFTLYNPDVEEPFYDSILPPTAVEIPVNILSDSTIIYIDFIDTTENANEVKVTDVLAFSTTNQTTIEELECGVVTEFFIRRVQCSFNHIDSAFFTNNVINSQYVNHVEIYY